MAGGGRRPGRGVALHAIALRQSWRRAPLSSIFDNFNRADSTTALGTTSDGLATWIPQAGTWGISSNQAYCPAPSGSTTATVDSGSSDGTVSVKIATLAPTSFFAGISFRLQDNLNFMCMLVDAASVRFFSRIGGSFNSLGSVTMTVSAGDTLSVVFVGSSISAKVNGTTVLSITSSLFSTQTKHGLYTERTEARFDDWNFSAPHAAPPWRPQIRRQAVFTTASVR